MKIKYSKLFGLVAFMLPGLMWMANSAAGDLSNVDESSSTAHVEETNELLIFLKPGTDPRVFASRQGLEIKYQLLSDPNAYVLTAPSVPNAKQALQNVINDPDPDTASAYLNLKTLHERNFAPKVETDPFFYPFSNFPGQWYLYNTYTPGLDARVLGAWARKDINGGDIIGTGVTIGIIDDGLEKDHADIKDNYVAADSWDFGQNDSDPSPVTLNDMRDVPAVRELKKELLSRVY